MGPLKSGDRPFPRFGRQAPSPAGAEQGRDGVPELGTEVDPDLIIAALVNLYRKLLGSDAAVL